ncbi:hypothetical protein POX_g08938 [Penicillium oxalicum]|uniref:hypothetical protein n=1 Tax=Penicillium oxalicum TaxID=69781 RepID=UPI0020B880F8|nr:hypothetical protein POX_g08938 [Penicillium oxalicum]KAI2786552.1 hypothetical protein POX_g08938 [Penicillium oxalicum]
MDMVGKLFHAACATVRNLGVRIMPTPVSWRFTLALGIRRERRQSLCSRFILRGIMQKHSMLNTPPGITLRPG